MPRIALRTRLKPGAEEAYEREHATIPAELEADMREAGVRSWTIWRDGLDLFHVVEVDDWAAMQERMRDSAADQAWQSRMNRFLDRDFDPSAIRLREVWKM
ncbi:L-rhamnose mutarotase [Sphaerisporangium sp. TRM90804]|uniref:L-rhamnose mutarotase n=1 Tax=Sphaerisporangium sp. TRM90804 TaxID=3031113 RepID=UPI00244AF56F|nr:L-rhamnose mutarotase [Sphaerisporangium sp. TRM90804]MDH2427708.1 L-rhamnose mutarotase [Sphaerisporangium sp. TRM90804]